MKIKSLKESVNWKKTLLRKRNGKQIRMAICLGLPVLEVASLNHDKCSSAKE